MNLQLYAKGDYGLDTLVKTLGTLRRKNIGVTDIYSKDVESTYSDIFITLKGNDYNQAIKTKQLLDKLYCLGQVKIIG